MHANFGGKFQADLEDPSPTVKKVVIPLPGDQPGPAIFLGRVKISVLLTIYFL